jgi:hypothetical protein
MKDHRRFEELIQGYVDKALDDKELKSLEKHLKSCEACAKKLEERKKLSDKLRSSKEEIRCPDDLIDNILKSTTRKEAPEIISTFKIRWKYMAVSAAAALIVISTVLLNIEEIDRTPAAQEDRKKREEIISKAPKISETEEISLAEKKTEDEKKEVASRTISKEPGQAKLVLPEKKMDFVAVEEDKGSSLSGSIQDYEESGKAAEQVSTIPEEVKSRPLIKMDMSQAKAPPSKTASEREKAYFSVTEDALNRGLSSESSFEETRFVFPEEGSVVGNDFEIVLILEKPEEEIEISLDGERITNYTKEEDSNIIFIGSDSIPPLEEGLHFLSLKTKEEKNITFYKEG